MKPYEDANVTSEEEAQIEGRIFADSSFVRQLAVVEDNQLKRFLLGNVTSEEEAQLEDRLFDDSDFVRQLAVVEEELIDDYLCERLTDDERIRFESHFMTLRQAPELADMPEPPGFDDRLEAPGFDDRLEAPELADRPLSSPLTRGSTSAIDIMTSPQAPGQSEMAYVRREQLLMVKALKRYAANSKRGSAVRMGENRLDFRHWIRAFFPRWQTMLFLSTMRSAPVSLALILVAGFGILFLSLSFFTWQSATDPGYLPLDKGLDALGRAYRDRRLIEARITGFDYAILTNEPVETADPVAQHNLEVSLTLLSEAVRTNADAESFHALGKFYLARGDFDQSAAHFKTALKLAPNVAAIHSDLGAALLLKLKSEAAQGRGVSQNTAADEASLHINKALELMPVLLEALFNRGLLYEALKLDEPARDSWETYLTRDNDSRWAEEAKKKLEALR